MDSMTPKLSCIHIVAIITVFLCAQITTSSTEEASTYPNHTISCNAHERSALLAFKAGFSDPKKRLSSWKGDECCQWNGVHCSNRTGLVISIDLHGPGCDDIPPSMQVLGGNISSSLLGLCHLRYLNLSCNQFDELRIPEFLGSLHELRYLDLSWSSFVGKIPPQLGNLSHLHYFSLANNFDPDSDGLLSTALHSTDVNWLSRLSSLEHLAMDNVNLSTAENWVSVVNMLHSLRFLSLSSCYLPGSHNSLLHSNLTSLETLDISENNLQERIAPNWFWDLINLKELDASWNQFYGPFPYELGNMTSIVRLYLQRNNLVGMIPSNLNDLCDLEELSLGYNNISGSLTELFQRLPPYCSRNNTTRSLPTKLSEPLTNLALLDLSMNGLTGRIPPSIGEFTKLTTLDLAFNSLDGVMHEGHFSGLKSLKFLSMSDNSIAVIVNSSWVTPFNLKEIYLGSCQLGPKFPAWLRWQTNVISLDLSNTSISDVLPYWFSEVFSSADYINMRNNKIRGVLPNRMEFMGTTTLNLGSNQFSGRIPKLPNNLSSLDLSRNNISGPLPENFGALGLQRLILIGNTISGMIPSSLCNFKSLQLLDLSENGLTGSSPDCIFNVSMTNNTSSYLFGLKQGLQVVNLRNNKLSGEFPSFIQSCEQLVFLDLTENQFHGTLPPWIGEKLHSLVFLRLRSNMFSGPIPASLTKLVNLQYLDLAYNRISGSIPHSLVNLKGMTETPTTIGAYVELSYSFSIDDSAAIDYTENITIVTKGQVRLYTGEIIYMVNLDLSCNNLTGKIPEEIGTLIGLNTLNLSWNAFSGEIPQTIGALAQVESLDLSHNELSGEIPTSLSALTSLSHLNLSYNNLIGKIPTGNQLQVLDDLATVYIGNTGLCGPPLSKKCPETGSDAATPEDHQYRNADVFLFVAIGSGFIMGLWTVFFIFLFKANWRILCFAFYDRLYDWVHVQVAVSLASVARTNG